MQSKEDKKKESAAVDQILIDTLLERPITFSTLDGRFFSLYQPSLGVSLLASDIMKTIEIDEDCLKVSTHMELIHVAMTQRPQILRLLALYSFKRRSDVMDEELVAKRVSEFGKVIDTSDLVTLFIHVNAWNTWFGKLQKKFALDLEKETKKRVQEVNKSDRGLTFGGRSIYGQIVDFACERYGWSLGYVLWGISLTNLNMMMSDSVTTMYVSKEELAKNGISTDNEILRAEDPANMQRIKEIVKRRRSKA